MEKTTVTYSLLCLSLLLAGCRGGEERKTAPVEVRTWKVAPSYVEGGREYSGTVEEAKGSILSFAVGSTVERLLVHEGQRIAQGELIAVLDKRSLEQTCEAAQATLEQATDAYDRMKRLHDNNSLPEMQWVEVQSRLRQARSAESIARKALADCRLYAPFSGVISAKYVEEGQNVGPGMPVVKLVSIARVKVSIAVPENEMSAIAPGRPVRIRVAALGGKPFAGTIVEKGVAANTLSRAYDVKIAVDNPQGELLPGMLCEACIDTEERQTAIVVSAGVVQLTSDNRHFVWIDEGGKAVRRPVRIGEAAPHGVTVMEGLDPGDEVIVEGQQKVSEGMEIVKQQ